MVPRFAARAAERWRRGQVATPPSPSARARARVSAGTWRE
jgi:hypothetical protein